MNQKTKQEFDRLHAEMIEDSEKILKTCHRITLMIHATGEAQESMRRYEKTLKRLGGGK